VKYKNVDLLVDSHNNVNRWKNYFSLLLNVHNVSDVRQIGTHSAEPLVPDLSPYDFEAAIETLKKYKLQSSDQIPAELIQGGSETVLCEILKLNHSVWNKNCLIMGKSLLMYQSKGMATK
jgi:hypothetical protein